MPQEIKNAETQAKECNCTACKRYLNSLKDSGDCVGRRPRKPPKHLKRK